MAAALRPAPAPKSGGPARCSFQQAAAVVPAPRNTQHPPMRSHTHPRALLPLPSFTRARAHTHIHTHRHTRVTDRQAGPARVREARGAAGAPLPRCLEEKIYVKWINRLKVGFPDKTIDERCMCIMCSFSFTVWPQLFRFPSDTWKVK